MPNSWNDIRTRALAFSKEWAGTESEDAEGKSFLDAFFGVFGIPRRRVASFEARVKKVDGRDGYIDLLWKGTLLIEQKSRGKDLERAYKQAIDYFPGLKDAELPRFVLVSDFWRFRLYDLDNGTHRDFKLNKLHENVQAFGFMLGYQSQVTKDQDPINIEAVEKMGDLHDLLKKDGYTGHPLEIFLVRLLFCLFADDTGIFSPKDAFEDLVKTFTRDDGADLGPVLDQLFKTLNKKEDLRQRSLPDHFNQFPHVNGKLFEQHFDPPAFNREMRDALLSLMALNWGAISPAIFGAMFQRVIELDAKDRRRQLGAHYTSEENILKLIGPLFLDELREEFAKIKHQKNKLFEFKKKLRTLTFLDPACGCGNFLVISYRELRRLELDVLRAASKFGQRTASVFEIVAVNVDQFYGIEIEDFPAQVAQVAMWLMDHQMNVEAGEEFGEPMLRIPLQQSARIEFGDALRFDWARVVPPKQLNYILGNPPFVGKALQDKKQKEGLEFVTEGLKGAGVLDYVAGWYLKAADYITAEPDGFGGMRSRASRDRDKSRKVQFASQDMFEGDLFVDDAKAESIARRHVKCAFVSTNSITQGEQVGVLWSHLLSMGISIHFAHRTFQWMNEAPGKAAVHCVIIGFAAFEPTRRQLFDYADVKAPPKEHAAKNINPYLVDAPNVTLISRRQPISKVPEIVFGSMPNDGGHLLMSSDEKASLLSVEPEAEKWIRPFLGADEFLNGIPRWCLWLVDARPTDMKALKEVRKLIDETRKHREASTRATTKSLATTPHLFGEIRQPKGNYLLVPRHSSERREIIPIGFMPPEVIVGDANLCIPNAEPIHFGVMNSRMHMAWVKFVCGRLESRYRYTNQIVYNNFPWPSLINEAAFADAKSAALRDAISAAAEGVLDARNKEVARDSGVTLAILYNPETMPSSLKDAHVKLDRAVDAAYLPDGGSKAFADDAERAAFLFEFYQRLTSLLPSE
jgi:N-6 DNA Methylase